MRDEADINVSLMRAGIAPLAWDRMSAEEKLLLLCLSHPKTASKTPLRDAILALGEESF